VAASGLVGRTGDIDDVAAIWQYDDCQVAIRGSWIYVGFTMSFEAAFEQAVLEYGMHPDPALRVRRVDVSGSEKVALPAKNAYFEELRYFFACCRGQQTNTVCPAESTRASVAMVMLESRRSGKASGSD